MASKVPNITNIPELNRRIFYTLLFLAIYRVGVFIPTPGIDSQALAGFFGQALFALEGQAEKPAKQIDSS